MLSQPAFWLAVLPPLFAILVERFNPINGTVVRANAERDLKADFPLLSDDDRNALLGVLERAGAAIGEVSGLAPTLIASIISGFVVIHELTYRFSPSVIYVLSLIYVLAFAFLALYLWWLLSGRTFAQISGQNAAIPWFGGEVNLSFKRTAVVAFTIYLANILLIIFVVVVFWIKGTNEEGPREKGTIPYSVEETLRKFELRMNDLQDHVTQQEHEIAELNERSSRPSWLSTLERITATNTIIVLSLIVGGVALVILGPGITARVLGAMSLAVGAAAGLHFIEIKDLRIDKLIDLELKRPQITVESPIKVQLSDGGEGSAFEFGPEYLGNVAHFPIGIAKIEPDGIEPGYYDENPEKPERASAGLERVCQKWKDHGTNEALVLITGATDRLPLGNELRSQYEANTGLALARAVETKNYLDKHCWSPPNIIPKKENILLLSSGPRTTPGPSQVRTSKWPNNGFPDDRRVDVWILSKIVNSHAGGHQEKK